MTNKLVSLNRRRRSDMVAAVAIAIVALVVCVLCLLNGDAAACAGALVVFGMAFAAVMASGSNTPQAPVRTVAERPRAAAGRAAALPTHGPYPRLARIA
jgi:hypothetical protein